MILKICGKMLFQKLEIAPAVCMVVVAAGNRHLKGISSRANLVLSSEAYESGQVLVY